MTVADLIERLKELPPDVPVYIEANLDYYDVEVVGGLTSEIFVVLRPALVQEVKGLGQS